MLEDVLPTAQRKVDGYWRPSDLLAFVPDGPKYFAEFLKKDQAIVRAKVTHLADGATCLSVTFPHVAFDLESIKIVMQNWAREYTLIELESLVALNGSVKAGDRPLTFADFQKNDALALTPGCLDNGSFEAQVLFNGLAGEAPDLSSRRDTPESPYDQFSIVTPTKNQHALSRPFQMAAEAKDTGNDDMNNLVCEESLTESVAVCKTSNSLNRSVSQSNSKGTSDFRANMGCRTMYGRKITLKYASKRIPEGFVPHIFEPARLKNFPRIIGTLMWNILSVGPITTVACHFSKEELQTLKKRANAGLKERHGVAWVSTNDVLMARVWQVTQQNNDMFVQMCTTCVWIDVAMCMSE